jgi:exonuclease SbcD
MHLGRPPGSLPPGLPAVELGPREAWNRVVTAALEHRVHCVALAGDLVQSDNSLFEAYGQLKDGIGRLSEAGIQVVAVAGNHDTETLPRLADEIPHCHLLGRGGTWSTHTVTSDGGPPVRLSGWSFPASHHRASPLQAGGLPAADPGMTTLGLLHADLVAGGGSDYAPVTAREFAAAGYQGWYLGHIHLPGDLTTDGAPFYLGSLSPLTPNERGLHGPVLVEVADRGPLRQQRLPLAPLRWEELTVDCTGRDDLPKNLRGAILEAINHLQQELAGQLDKVQALGLRVVLTGRVARPEALARELEALALADLEFQEGQRTVFVQKATFQVAGDFDLEALAAQDHPAGILARQILILGQDGGPVPGVDDPAGARAQLLHEARLQIQEVDGRNQFARLKLDFADGPPGEEDLVAQLLSVARQALAHLIAGKEGDHAAG